MWWQFIRYSSRDWLEIEMWNLKEGIKDLILQGFWEVDIFKVSSFFQESLYNSAWDSDYKPK